MSLNPGICAILTLSTNTSNGEKTFGWRNVGCSIEQAREQHNSLFSNRYIITNKLLITDERFTTDSCGTLSGLLPFH